MSLADPFSSRFEVFGRESTYLINEINQPAFERLKRLLDVGDGGDGRVILLRAPRAGFGKTSLLQRLSEQFGESHHFVRINLVGGRTTDAAHVLEYVLQALCRVLPDSTTLTDLDIVARKILALGLEPLVASGEVPCQDREGALVALREQPAETFDFHHDRAVTAHWTKSNFEILGPRLAAELARLSGASLREASYWVELLFRFATTAPDNVERARLLFETVFRADLQNQSESGAEERLHGLLALLGTVTRLVLIVDDTEGLSTNPPDALELASFLTNVSQCCPGTLVLLSVNSDVWETAFLPLLPGGLADRLTEYVVSLDPISKKEARKLIGSRAGAHADQVLAEIEWPEGDLFSRQVLKAASDAWESLAASSSLKAIEEKPEKPEKAEKAPAAKQEKKEDPVADLDNPFEDGDDLADPGAGKPAKGKGLGAAAAAAATVVAAGAAGGLSAAGKDDDSSKKDEAKAKAAPADKATSPDRAEKPEDKETAAKEDSAKSDAVAAEKAGKKPRDTDADKKVKAKDSRNTVEAEHKEKSDPANDAAKPVAKSDARSAGKGDPGTAEKDDEPVAGKKTKLAAAIGSKKGKDATAKRDPDTEEKKKEKDKPVAEDAASPFKAKASGKDEKADEVSDPFTAVAPAPASPGALSPFAPVADEEDDPSFVANVGEVIDAKDDGPQAGGSGKDSEKDKPASPFVAKTASLTETASVTEENPFTAKAKAKSESPDDEADNPFTTKESPESGKTDAPKTDAPKTDAPKTDAPKTDAPKTDAPKTAVAADVNPFTAKASTDATTGTDDPSPFKAATPPPAPAEPIAEAAGSNGEPAENPFIAAAKRSEEAAKVLREESSPFSAPPKAEGKSSGQPGDAPADQGEENPFMAKAPGSSSAEPTSPFAAKEPELSTPSDPAKKEKVKGKKKEKGKGKKSAKEAPKAEEDTAAALPPSQDSPFAPGKSPLAPEPEPKPKAEEREPASPFAALGGITGSEKNLGDVSSIFDPIKPDEDAPLDTEKLKPLLERADEATAKASAGDAPAPATDSIFKAPATDAGSAGSPFQPGPAGPTSASPFKPVASTPSDSPFAPGPAGDAANQPPSGPTPIVFGTGTTAAQPASNGPFAPVKPPLPDFDTALRESQKGLGDGIFGAPPEAPPEAAASDPAGDTASGSGQPPAATDAKDAPSGAAHDNDAAAKAGDGSSGTPEAATTPFQAKGPAPSAAPDDSPFAKPPAAEGESTSPFKPVASAPPSEDSPSPFAKGEPGSIPEGLSGQRTELPPRKVSLSSPPTTPSPFEPGTHPGLDTPAPASPEGGETPFKAAAPPSDPSPFSSVGSSPGLPPKSFGSPAPTPGEAKEPATDQDRVDELLRQFKERYGRD